MSITRWTSGLLATTATVGLLLAVPGVAAADDPSPDPEPGPITITLTPEESARVCDVRIPRVLDRVTRVTERINGDAATVGSVAFLQERAEQARSQGRAAVAERLDRWADRRAGRVDQLADVRAKVEAFDAKHCGS